MEDTMNELTSIVISGVTWDAIKKGVSITTNYLKEKLSKWLLDDAALEEIKECIGNIPEPCLRSEELIKAHIDLDDRILNILKSAKSVKEDGDKIEQEIHGNNGIIIGKNSGQIIFRPNTEEPRTTHGKKLLLANERSEFNPVQIVKSFSGTRDECIVKKGKETVVYADVVIPEEVKNKGGCQFLMILFSYRPSENWINYFDEKYKLKFSMKTSDNIKKVQLQIKNTQQQQFVDKEIEPGYFSYLLSEIATREAWRDVGEICFTVFAEDECIVGEKGFIQIDNIQLEA